MCPIHPFSSYYALWNKRAPWTVRWGWLFVLIAHDLQGAPGYAGGVPHFRRELAEIERRSELMAP